MSDPDGRRASVRQSRQRVEAALAEVRTELEGEVGYFPQGTWLLPLLAGAVGVTLGLALRQVLRASLTPGSSPEGEKRLQPGEVEEKG